MKNTKKLVLSSIVTALSTFIMIIAGFIPIGTYAIPVIASLLYVILVKEAGISWAVMSYAATSLLSLIVCLDKEAAVCFILFFGYYPILKMIIEKIKLKIVSIIIKLIVFNASMTGIFFIAKYLLMIPDDAYTVFGLYIPWLMLALGNIVFIIYDYALSGLVKQYDRHWSSTLKKIIKM